MMMTRLRVNDVGGVIPVDLDPCRVLWKSAINSHKCVADIANVFINVPTKIDEHAVDFGIVAIMGSFISI